MAKETLITFVYDLQKLQREEDDPSTAILYFHPNWVSDQQKTSLCGQLMGITHCLKNIFDSPRIISLESGKFVIVEFGRYLLVVGTDRNVEDWVLQYRADILSSLISFYHEGIEAMSTIYTSGEVLSAKLYHILETYLKMLTFGGNIFSYIPTIALPKSASNIFIEAMIILQSCQNIGSVLGGLLLYHNKVVATQLPSNLTKNFVLTDPYRIKSPAEVLDVDFQLPHGVQLLQVYISNSQYQLLNKNHEKSKNALHKLKQNSSKTVKKTQTSKEPIPSTMKRDCSLIFTSVPEEDLDDNSTSVIKDVIKPITRPKFLNLKSKTIDIPEVLERPKPAVTTPFANQAIVASTPMTELNKVLHLKTISICKDPDIGTDTKGNIADSKQGNLIRRCFSLNELADKPKVVQKTKSLDDSQFRPFDNDGATVRKTLRDARNIVKGLLANEFVKDKAFTKSNFFKKSANGRTFSKIKNDVPNNSQIDDNAVELKEIKRKSLTLPLKSLSSEPTEQNTPLVQPSTGVLLTPLMHKLTTWVFEEKSSGFCSYSTTPIEGKEFGVPQMKRSFSRSKLRDVTEECPVDEGAKKCILFVCGQQDTVVGLLMKPENFDTCNVVNELWDLCTEQLPKLEKQLHQCMETYPTNSLNDREPYSFLCLDNQWDNVKRCGPWGDVELKAITHLHRDLKESSNVTEILWRGPESLIYAYHSGEDEVFYHQPETGISGGLPTPSDPMGVLPVKAKRVLERDHGVILL